ncbi:MAG: hypothetical protein R8N23_03565 [Reichenbachiella sp.]|uniref:hypothetical protein n=1 Tax=Reichenbachiella sp. TaxID=2184521 RepID=UPI0029672EE7|nr:hypothetical protein [Reichenbachiella sp.]MDW3208916.1 hypothetical protein [Reichenbachiella sp.]
MAIIFHSRPDFNLNESPESLSKAHRILNSREFIKLSGGAHYSETEYEKSVISGLRQIIGDKSYIIPYKKDIQNLNGIHKNAPDIMIINKSLQTWFIVELELIKPGIGHAIEQLCTFQNYVLKSIIDEIDYIKTQINNIDPFFKDYENLEKLLQTKTAHVVLMAEHVPPTWRIRFKEEKIRCLYCTYQIYNDENNQELFRINDGDAFSEIIKERYLDIDLLNNCLILKNGSKIFYDRNSGDELQIIVDQEPTRWRIEKKTKHVKLFYIGVGFPLPTLTKKVSLVFRENRLELRYL